MENKKVKPITLSQEMRFAIYRQWEQSDKTFTKEQFYTKEMKRKIAEIRALT